MSDTPWTDSHRDGMTVHIDDVMELERSHQRLLEALKAIRRQFDNKALSGMTGSEVYCSATAFNAINQSIC